MVGCECTTCLSNNPKNKRTRCSAAIQLDDGKMILIDTGPDLRFQALRERITRVDAVLYTHIHADHLNGIDDLRAFCQLHKMQIPLYGNSFTMQNISERFGYALRDPGNGWEMPVLKATPILESFDLFGEKIIPIEVMHGKAKILGWRIRNFAWLTDVSEIPEHSLSLLHGIDVLMLDCLRTRPHHTHINVEQSLDYAAKIGAKSTYLIHMTHDLEYDTLQNQLPENIFVGYDGLRLEMN